MFKEDNLIIDKIRKLADLEKDWKNQAFFTVANQKKNTVKKTNCFRKRMKLCSSRNVIIYMELKP